MRADIVQGGAFPDYELPDHESVPRKLSEIRSEDPLILTLARGHYCPKEHQQHLELAANFPKVNVAYTKMATITTDEHHTLQEFRNSVGAQWPFLSDPERIVQKDLDIQEYTDPDNDPMIPHTLLGPPVVHRSLARPAGGRQRDPPRLGPRHARPTRGLGRGQPRALPRMEQAGRSTHQRPLMHAMNRPRPHSQISPGSHPMVAYFLLDNVEVSDPGAGAPYFPEAAKVVAEYPGALPRRGRRP